MLPYTLISENLVAGYAMSKLWLECKAEDVRCAIELLHSHGKIVKAILGGYGGLSTLSGSFLPL